MSTIIVPVFPGDAGATTLTGVASTITDNIDKYDKEDTTIMALTSTVSTALNGCASNTYAAEAYLDSLSEEQMLELERQLEQKETMMINGQEFDLTFDTQQQEQTTTKTI